MQTLTRVPAKCRARSLPKRTHFHSYTEAVLEISRTAAGTDPALDALGDVFLQDGRYSRQVLFPPIGEAGQRHLQKAHVAIVGCGATGAASAALLVRAGVGRLTLIDRDFVEPSNLQRQMLFTESDAAEALPKAEAARRRLSEINREVEVQAEVADLTPASIHRLLQGCMLVLDGTDNFETRYLLNDYAVAVGKPWIYAAAIGSYAATMNILPPPLPEPTACLACIFPELPTGTVETCDTAGILNTAVNLASSLQVTEALKILTGNTAALRRTLWSMDLWTGEHSAVSATRPRPGCRVCGAHDFQHLRGDARPTITMCGRNSVQIHEHHRPVDFSELAARLQPHGDVRFNSMMLRFHHGSCTLNVFADGRTVVQGTSDTARARTLYARFVGS